jgi:hypothetical protein
MKVRFVERWTESRPFQLGALVAAVAVLITAGLGACSSSDDDDANANDAGAEANASAPQVPPDNDASGTAPPLAKLADLVADDSVWSLLANPGQCNLREAKVVPDPFPKRTWTSCGPGCSVTPANLPFQEGGLVDLHPSGCFIDGEVYLATSMRAGSLGRIGRVERLSDGATLAAWLDRGKYRPERSCISSWQGSAPLLFTLYDERGVLFGRAPRTPGSPVVWNSTWVEDLPDIANERFLADDGYGVGTEGALLFLKAPTATSSIDLQGDAHAAHGLGDQIVWGGGSGVLRSYTAAGGALDLLSVAPRIVRAVRLSDARLVWFDAARNGDLLTDLRWHWSPRARAPAAVVVHDGPAIPIVTDSTGMQLGGDWAATMGCGSTTTLNESNVHIWNITTGESWVLPQRPGWFFYRVVAISPWDLLLGEIPFSETPSTADHISNFVRLDLSALPAIVEAWSN